MAVWDYNGSTSTSIATIYDYNGSTSTAINSVYDYNGSTSTQVYAATVAITNMVTNPLLKVGGAASTSGWATGDPGIYAGVALDSGLVRIQSYGYSGTNYTWISQGMSFTAASKYYVKIYGNKTTLNFFLDNFALGVLLQMPSSLGYAGVILNGNQFHSSLGIRWIGQNAYPGNVVYPLWGGCSIVNLTSTFGSGSEPDVTWCNANIPIFEGTTAVPRP